MNNTRITNYKKLQALHNCKRVNATCLFNCSYPTALSSTLLIRPCH